MSQPTILKLKVRKTGHASITFRNFFKVFGLTDVDVCLYKKIQMITTFLDDVKPHSEKKGNLTNVQYYWLPR